MRKRRAASRSFVETKQATDAREIPGTRAEKETSASRRRDVKWRGGVTQQAHGTQAWREREAAF